ncbi:IAA-amino acid hydrolase ILR1-like 4 [Sesamum alatum]|uniref:IAA-amino acid hydrolase ILR1-like 4 n=1 Tax=Sesamum alatum TaxID=300844 RepID=A0AAE2CMG5_9LAMI|nr:IAA-amino acid hydrolase ILR1-like 4 [Sesamum alatum]
MELTNFIDHEQESTFINYTAKTWPICSDLIWGSTELSEISINFLNFAKKAEVFDWMVQERDPPFLAIRADMDALALQGTVVLVFQPGEEGGGGAKKMVKAGFLDNVQAIICPTDGGIRGFLILPGCYFFLLRTKDEKSEHPAAVHSPYFRINEDTLPIDAAAAAAALHASLAVWYLLENQARTPPAYNGYHHEFNLIVNQPVDHQDSVRVPYTSAVDASDKHGRGANKDVPLGHEEFGKTTLAQLFDRVTCLRSLSLCQCKLQDIPRDIENLIHLSLSRLRAINWPSDTDTVLCWKRWSRLGYLNKLDQLSGSLELRIRFHDREDVDEAWKAELRSKMHIQGLIIMFINATGRTQEDELLRNEAMEALQPPSNLQYSTIIDYQAGDHSPIFQNLLTMS